MAHPPVHQGRRRPATATAESGQRQRSPEKAWRSHLDSPPVFVGSRCDGAAHPNHSMGRENYLPGTRRGGVNDPAGLPAWRPVPLHPCRWLGVPRGTANGKKHPPGAEGCLTSTIFAGSPLVPESAGSESCAGVTGAAAYLDAFSIMVCRRATNASRCPLSRESRGSWSSIPVISYSSNPREGLIDSRPPSHSNLDMPL